MDDSGAGGFPDVPPPIRQQARPTGLRPPARRSPRLQEVTRNPLATGLPDAAHATADPFAGVTPSFRTADAAVQPPRAVVHRSSDALRGGGGDAGDVLDRTVNSYIGDAQENLPTPPQRSPPPKQNYPYQYNPSTARGVNAGTGTAAQTKPLEHHHVRGVPCTACLVEKQTKDLEAMRMKLAHATSEAESLRLQQDILHQERPRSPNSVVQQQATLQGVGSSLNYYRDQIRQLKLAVAQSEAAQTNTENLLREALQRPPMPPPVPIKDNGAQTFGLDQVDILVNGEHPDSEASSFSGDEGYHRGGGKGARGGGFDEGTKRELIGEMRAAVGAEVSSALQKSSWLFGNTKTQAREVEQDSKVVGTAIPHLTLESVTSNQPEEIFYEMCAALGEAHAVNENQAIQVNNASSFWKLWHSGILQLEESLVAQIAHYETLHYLSDRVPPVRYCNNPLGFLFAIVVKTREDAEDIARRQEEVTQAQVLGMGKKLDETRAHEDEEPNFNLWTDLLKRLIILLSRNTHCLQPNVVKFEYEAQSMAGYPELRTYAPLHFAVENEMEEVVLLICDAQERLPVDYWECVQGYPFHSALSQGRAAEKSIKYMLRAASSVPDDRFGILKADDERGIFPFYLALMYAHDIPGVIDDLLDLLTKRNFKLNLKWTGWTEHEPREEWHLLQWAAYQGVERVFKQTRTHPDFFQKCQTSLEKGTTSNQPLHLACLSGSVGVVEMLCHEISQVLKAHAGPVWNEGQSPLHIAAQQCHVRCIEKILDFAKDKWGWSAKAQEEKLFGLHEHKTKWFSREDNFEYSVYNVALLTLVHRRHILSGLQTSKEEADDDVVANNEDDILRQKREIGVANSQVKFLNEKHPDKLRSFAASRIDKALYPWLVFIGIVTFFAASESAWLSDFQYFSGVAIENHFSNVAFTDKFGREKTLSNLDTQHEVQEWVHRALQDMPDTFYFTHTVPVGSTRLRQIIIRNDSCSVGPTFFRKTRAASGDVETQICSGAVSNPRTETPIDLLFDSVLFDQRDDHEQFKGPIPLLSGAESLWQSTAETQESSINSPLGYEYPGNGYTLDFDWGDVVRYKETLANFRGSPTDRFGSSSWMKVGTRALIVYTTFYNPQTDHYISGNILFELPPYGGVFVKTRFKPLRLLRNYDNYLDYVTIVFEFSIAAIVAFMAVKKIFEFRYLLKGHLKGFTLPKTWQYVKGGVKKVLTGGNVLDVTTIAVFAAVFTYRLLIRNEALEMESLFKEHLKEGVLETSFFFPFSLIASHYSIRMSAMGFVLMIVYMKILVIFRLSRNVGPISIAIVQTLFNMRIYYFTIILLLLLLSLSFAAYFAFGGFSAEFSSLFRSVCQHNEAHVRHFPTHSCCLFSESSSVNTGSSRRFAGMSTNPPVPHVAKPELTPHFTTSGSKRSTAPCCCCSCFCSGLCF